MSESLLFTSPSLNVQCVVCRVRLWTRLLSPRTLAHHLLFRSFRPTLGSTGRFVLRIKKSLQGTENLLQHSQCTARSKRGCVSTPVLTTLLQSQWVSHCVPYRLSGQRVRSVERRFYMMFEGGERVQGFMTLPYWYGFTTLTGNKKGKGHCSFFSLLLITWNLKDYLILHPFTVKIQMYFLDGDSYRRTGHFLIFVGSFSDFTT